MSQTPSPAANAAQIDYWNATAGRIWAQFQEHLDRQIAPLGLEALRVLAPRAGERILDVGCGCGQTTLDLAARVGSGSWSGPEVVLLDGGRGQLSAAAGALDGGPWRPRLLMAIAKPNERRGTDAVFSDGRAEPLPLAAGAPVLLLLQRVRDEAHRFAVAYHRVLRSKRLLAGPLEGIPGLGKARQKRLLAAFGDLAGVKSAGVSELAGVVPAAVAAAVHAALHPDDPAAGQAGPASGA